LDFEARDDVTIMKRVTPAISKGISENKETMIDALYPIMGGMISKYVTQAIKEMMESINKKIEQGLSFERIKRKAKSKLTGVSETELLLNESTDAVISSMFVIHKETSLLIAEAHLENKEIDDAHMVASMASAIKDFINDWMQHSDAKNEVQLLSYGNATLYIESAGSVFIVAFLDAEPDHELRIEINTFFASIVKQYANVFQKFDGENNRDEIVTLSMEMEDYLYSQEIDTKIEKKNPAKVIFMMLGFLLVAYGVYMLYGWYGKHNLEQLVLSETGEHISISDTNKAFLLEGQVDSIERIYEIEQIIKKHSKKPIINKMSVPLSYLDDRFKDEKNVGKSLMLALEKKLHLLEKSYKKSLLDIEQNSLHLEQELNTSKSYLSGILKETTAELSILRKEKKSIEKLLDIKSEIYKELDKRFLNEKYYDKEKHHLNFKDLVLFNAGETVYNIDAIKVLEGVFIKYLSVLYRYKDYIKEISIEGHTDSSGREEDNVILSKKRALNVKDYLEGLKSVSQFQMQEYMNVKGYGSSQRVFKNKSEDSKASRRIEITFSLNDAKILNKLGEIIHD